MHLLCVPDEEGGPSESAGKGCYLVRDLFPLSSSARCLMKMQITKAAASSSSSCVLPFLSPLLVLGIALSGPVDALMANMCTEKKALGLL